MTCRCEPGVRAPSHRLALRPPRRHTAKLSPSAWNRTFWVVFVANLVTAIGMMSFLPFFPSFLEELGIEDRDELAAWTGVVFGAAPLAAAVMGPIWGSIGDRFGRKLMVLRSLLAITFFVGAMGFARTPWELLILRFGQGIFSGFVPPSITLVSIAAPKDRQGRVAGSLQSALAIGSIVGPLVGAFLQGEFGIRSVFTFVAVASGLSALSIGLFAEEEPGLRTTLERFSPTTVLGSTWRDLAIIFRAQGLRTAVLVLFLVQFGLGATNPLMELLVRDLWKGDPARIPHLTSLLFTAPAIAIVVATPLWGRFGDRVGHRRALLRSALGSAVAFVLHGLAPAYALLFGARLAIGATSAGSNAAAFGVAAVETRPENRGSAFGAVFSARALAVSLGAMVGGTLAAWIGIRGLFWVAGGTVGVALLIGRYSSAKSSASESGPADAGRGPRAPSEDPGAGELSSAATGARDEAARNTLEGEERTPSRRTPAP